MNKNRNEFRVVFDGDVKELNSDILISNLIHTTNILREVNRELKGPKLEINIKPFAPGSYDIAYAILHVGIISGLFNVANKETLGYLIKITSEFFNLKKFLGGKKPAEISQEGGQVKIKNKSGEINYFDNRSYKIYKINGNANVSLNKVFNELEENERIESLQIIDKSDKKLFEAKRGDFKKMKARNELLLERTKEKIQKRVKLVLYRIIFAQDRKWAFIYHENIISAYITDCNFHINDHRFGSGDYIEADLKIYQKYDETAGAYINIDYEVIKIYNIKEREKQHKISN